MTFTQGDAIVVGARGAGAPTPTPPPPRPPRSAVRPRLVRERHPLHGSLPTPRDPLPPSLGSPRRRHRRWHPPGHRWLDAAVTTVVPDPVSTPVPTDHAVVI